VAFDRDLLAKYLREDDYARLGEFVQTLKSDAGAPGVLEALARDRDTDMRSWAAAVARETVGIAALPWLVSMARGDRNFENRDLAMLEVLELDPSALKPMVPRLRSQLRHKDPDFALDAARALTRIGDAGALPAMHALAESWDPDLYYRKMLEVYILALEGRVEVILGRVRAHDHVCMPWLAHAARTFVRTNEARQVLEWGAVSLPDDECRGWCARAIIEGHWPEGQA
jgi:hypothetical protein